MPWGGLTDVVTSVSRSAGAKAGVGVLPETIAAAGRKESRKAPRASPAFHLFWRWCLAVTRHSPKKPRFPSPHFQIETPEVRLEASGGGAIWGEGVGGGVIAGVARQGSSTSLRQRQSRSTFAQTDVEHHLHRTCCVVNHDAFAPLPLPASSRPISHRHGGQPPRLIFPSLFFPTWSPSPRPTADLFRAASSCIVGQRERGNAEAL